MSAEKTELERMLEGRQAVEWGVVQEGDIVVGNSSGYMSSVNAGDIGEPIDDYAAMGFRIYRKIPVAKQGDLDAPLPTPEKPRAKALGKAKTDDSAKPPLAWLPWEACNQMAMVQRYGQKKYGSFLNYRKGMEVSRNCSCAIRHIRDFMNGIDRDPESGESPLAHAMVRLAFIIENIKDGKAIDDRKEGPSL